MEIQINQDMCKKHYRALVFSCYMAYVKKHHPTYDLNSLVESLGLSMDYLSNPAKWVSVEFDNLFTNKLVESLNDVDLPYKAGQLTYAKESLGDTLGKVVQISASMNYIYKIAPKSVHFFNKIFTMELVDYCDDSFYQYQVTPDFSLLETDSEKEALKNNLKHIYRNFIGHFCAITAIKYNNPDLITPHQVIEENDERLIFRIDLSKIKNKVQC